MDWNQYLQEILKNDQCLNNIQIYIENQIIELPQIVKASVFLLEKMLKNEGTNNIFVFPDGEQIPFLYMLSILIYDVHKGKIGNHYSPEDFTEGQILKLGNCVMQFLKVGAHPKHPDEEAIFLKFADVDSYCCPLNMAPYFQISDTKKKLSKKNSYVNERKKLAIQDEMNDNPLQEFKAIKTHVNQSIFYVSLTGHSELLASEIKIEEETIFDYFLVAKVNYLGKVQTYKGKLVGVPALVFSSRLAYVNEAIERGARVHSIIINMNDCDVNSQLDALDELLQRKIPVLCITDTANSTDLRELDSRKFNLWRWDSESITAAVQSKANISSEKKMRICLNANVVYHSVFAPEISEAFTILYRYKSIVDDENAQLNNIFSELLSMAYTTIINIRALKSIEIEQNLNALLTCRSILMKEQSFMRCEMYNDFNKVIDDYEIVFGSVKSFNKIEEIYKLLIEKRFGSFYLVCSNHDNPELVQKFWERHLSKIGYRPIIKVLCAKEYLALQNEIVDVLILTGWFNSDIVKKIIYGYKTKEIHIFTYECEERWKKAHIKNWKVALNNSSNNRIISNSFSKSITNLKIQTTEKITPDNYTSMKQDDLDLIVQENKYHRYKVREDSQTDIVVNAKPIGFVGGDFSFYTQGHKILVATNIILQRSQQIEKKEVDDIKVGDFVVVREASKDIIREVADDILKVNGKSDYRKTAALWQEALKIEEAFLPIDEIYRRLVEAGCTRNIMTVRNWITNEDIIIPQDIEDLEYIAQVTGDEVLLEKLDDIFAAGNFIKKVHIKAGRLLSDKLTQSIAKKLFEGEIEPYNIWDPIELNLEDVGVIKVLKVIDISQDWISVNINDTNKVLEERESILWRE